MIESLSPRVKPLLLAILVLVSLVEAAALRRGAVHNNDFKHLWIGSRLLAAGGNPYDADMMLLAARQEKIDRINPFVYLPATGLLMRPITILPYPIAEWLWFWMNWAAAWCCVIVGPRWLRAPRPRLAQWGGAMFLIGSLPFMRQMTAGQMNVALLAAFVLVAGLLARGRMGLAGLVLGWAAAFKITPLFLILALAGMRRWRAAFVAGATFASLMLLSLLLYGRDVHSAAWPVLSSMGYGKSTWAQFGNDYYRDPYNQSLNSLFHHLVTENPYSTPWFAWGSGAANLLTWIASAILLLTLTRWMLRYRRRPYFHPIWNEAENGLLMLALLAMLLLPSIMWDHYAVQALLPLIWVLGLGKLAHRPAHMAAVTITFMLLAIPLASHAPEYREGWRILLQSIRLWGTLGLLGLVHAHWTDAMRERMA